ncbi:MAG: glycoside hydrolase family 25 protein [Pelolinea sp.]|nr:glycoside hydrolase family 25 protein [Pelolinea sp.]
MVQGIDVSHWQDDKSTPQKMDFTKAVKMGAKFVFIKVSERGGIDRDFEYNWKAAKDAGLLRGGYHLLRWDLSGLLQARIFCDILGNDLGELPPVADFEAPNQGSLYPSNSLLEQFLVEVETITDKKPMLYTSPGYWGIHGRNKYTKMFDAKWAYYNLWVAHYMRVYTPGVSKPDELEPWKSNKKPWTFWQYTNVGDGIAYGAESKGIDLNWFNGSWEELKIFAGINDNNPPAPNPNPTPKPDIADLKSRVNKAIDNWAKTL